MAGDLSRTTADPPSEAEPAAHPAPADEPAPPVPAAPAVADSVVVAKREPQYGVFVGRFRLVYAILAILLGAAVGGLIVLTGRAGDEAGVAWSAWEPTTEGSERAREIADFVERRYRLTTGEQLVGVIAGEPTVQQLPVGYFAIQRGSDEDDIDIIRAEDSIAYQLCGLGQRCAIRTGKPTEERGRLLRREALELALYTFKYVDDVNKVVAYLPPPPGEQPSIALFFQKNDLEPVLDEPLERTLPHYQRISPERLSPAEAAAVDQLVDRHIFEYSFQQAPDGSAVLVLATAA